MFWIHTGVIDKANYPDELSFPGNRFVVSVNNFNRGKLTREDNGYLLPIVFN